ncbi:MAG: hypothetical protein JWN72_2893 [Thermoleophilia bacterium]|nr:hypothetical protein [Thermoleophilia bacterium]
MRVAAPTAPLGPTAPQSPAALVGATLDRARALPWLMQLQVGGEPVADIIERTPRFRFDGSGLLSRRTIVPETLAAQDALRGASGAQVERQLRGWLATYDAQSAVVQLEGVAFATDGRSAAVNNLLGGFAMPEAHTNAEVVERPTAAQRAAVQAELDAQSVEFDPERQAEPRPWGIAYPTISLSPATSEAFFDLAKGRPVMPNVIDRAAHVMVHELAHRMTPPDMSTLDPRGDPEGASALQLFSEGAADTIASLPGWKQDAEVRMGWPTAPEAVLSKSYSGFVRTIGALLAQAGLDTADAADRQPIIDLLERGPVADEPTALAAAIATHRGIAATHVPELASAIEHVGRHGIFDTDVNSYMAQQMELTARTRAVVELTDRLAAGD